MQKLGEKLFSNRQLGMKFYIRIIMIMMLVNFATVKYLVFKWTIFPHRSNHKYTWTFPDGKTHNQIDHILIDRRWHSIILDVRSFRGSNCDTDHYLAVAKVREGLAVSKHETQKSKWERFNLRKLNELEVRKQYQNEITNNFSVLEKVMART